MKISLIRPPVDLAPFALPPRPEVLNRLPMDLERARAEFDPVFEP
ncbi:hypothetical protein SAMN04244559_02838 [Magnetospirillum fulvum]|uniref:Uncharacterized protein n=1 Tax=Magnetospirillum fulvum TaxID=1082 RepID=A0A1H6J2G2_MAGFU|nr:hypothetical protein SAMN04244559_02838 [Magnetospirillum fulvum]